MRGETPAPSSLTLNQLVDEYLGQHVAEANTIQALRDWLKLAVDGIPVKPRAKEREHGLGDVRVDRLDARTVGPWRKRLPEGSAWHAHRALHRAFGSSVVYPGDRGGYLNLHAWRRDEWKPALESAGLPYLVPYSMRHTFASFRSRQA